MKRILFLVPLGLIVAACSSGPRHTVSNMANVPPPAPPRTAPPPQHGQSSNTVSVPQHVQSAGPLKTAMVSSYMDGQEVELRQRLRAYGINIARRGDGMVLNISNAVLFDGWNLTNSGNNLLATLAIVLRRYDHSAVNVGAYTDTTGEADQNMRVSDKRARVVADTLARDGVARARLSAQGFGETNLKIRTGDSVNESRNRRVEIRISPTPAG